MSRPVNPTIVPYQRKDGRTSYRIRVRANGRQTTETFPSLPAAEVFRLQCMDPAIGPDRAVEMRGRTDAVSPDYVPTLAEMVAKHIDGLTGIEQGTRDDYRAMAARTWLPVLGSLRVDELTRDDVARWVNAADRSHLKPKSIKNAHGLLSSVLETAVHDGHAERNPARRTRLPRAGEEDVDDIRWLTTEEYWRLHDAMAERYRPFLVTLFGTGLRYSEATALQVRDLDLTAGTLRVVRAWKHGKGPLRAGPPKSKASRRTVALPHEVVEALTPLAAGRGGAELVFTTSLGNVLRHGNFYNRFWLPACKAAGLDPTPRIHDARHSHASWLLAAGIPLEVIQDRLGHEDYNTTRRIYAHLRPDMRRAAALAAAAAFESRPLAIES